MTNYIVRDRRPIARHWRSIGIHFVDLLVRWEVHPNTISYCSVLFAILAALGLIGAKYADLLLLVTPLFFFTRLYCNMIDGMVAVKAGKCSAKGEIINELPDRISDTVIFLGLGLSGLADMMLAFWVIFGMLFGTYIGVLSKSVGARRQFGGLMSKQNRMFVLALGCWVQYFWMRPFPQQQLISVLDICNVLILLGLVQTIIVRIRSTFKELRHDINQMD